MSSWVRLAERLVSAVERLADATEIIAAMQVPEPSAPNGQSSADEIAMDDLKLRQTGRYKT